MDKKTLNSSVRLGPVFIAAFCLCFTFVVLELFAQTTPTQAVVNQGGTLYGMPTNSVYPKYLASTNTPTAGQVYTYGGPNTGYYSSPSGGGSGSVTNFTSGTLSPLFTSSVSSPTLNPSQTFTLSTSGTNTIFGNSTGSVTSPVYNATTNFIGTNSYTFAAGNDTRFPASVTGFRYGAGAGSADAAATLANFLTILSGGSGTLNLSNYTVNLTSAQIPNNAANTTGTAAGLSAASTIPNLTIATTQSSGDISQKLATDQFVANNFAPLASPVFTGTPVVPNLTAGTLSTQAVNANYVANAISGISGGGTSNPYSGFHNRIINGDFAIYQRAATVSITSTGGSAGGNTINTSSTTGVAVGQSVSGTGIPPNCTVLSFVSNTSIALSGSLTTTASGSYKLSGTSIATGTATSTTYSLDRWYAFATTAAVEATQVANPFSNTNLATTITNASNASPNVFTTSAAHGLNVGDQIFISGATGDTTMNGAFYVSNVPTSTTFTLAKPYSQALNTGGTYTTSTASFTRYPQFQTGVTFTGLGSNAGLEWGQKIEAANIADLADQGSVELSCYLMGSSSTTVTWTIYYPGATDTWTTRASVQSGTLSVTTIPQRFTAIVNAAALTNCTAGMEIAFSVTALGNPVTITMSGVQVEVGNAATTFEKLPANTELAQCQRYCCTSYDLGTATGTSTRVGIVGALNYNGSITSPYVINLPVPMRADPTLSYWDGAGNASRISQANNGTWTDNITPSTFTATTSQKSLFIYDSAAGQCCFFHYLATCEL